jgi:hypothetical protein
MGRPSKYPRFVMMMQDGKKGCAMILQRNDDYGTRRPEWEYWRDGGEWGIHIREENGKFVSDAKRYGEDLQYLDGQELIPITEAEWREDNGRYARSLKTHKKIDPHELPY